MDRAGRSCRVVRKPPHIAAQGGGRAPISAGEGQKPWISLRRCKSAKNRVILRIYRRALCLIFPLICLQLEHSREHTLLCLHHTMMFYLGISFYNLPPAVITDPFLIDLLWCTTYFAGHFECLHGLSQCLRQYQQMMFS